MHNRLFIIIAVLAAVLLGTAAWAADPTPATPAPTAPAAKAPTAPMAPPMARPGGPPAGRMAAPTARMMPGNSAPAAAPVPTAPPKVEPDTTPPTKADIDAAMKDGRYLATITMKDGKKITVVLEGKLMPYTVANFVKLARIKFYDDLTFFNFLQVEPKGKTPGIKIMLSGDPNNDGSGNAGYTIPLEVNPFLHVKRGVIAMYHRMGSPQTSSSQFFLAATDVKVLEGQVAVFGWVKDGIDGLDKINKGDFITSVTIARYSGKEACPVYEIPGPSKWKAPSLAEIDAVKAHGRFLATITLAADKPAAAPAPGKPAPNAAPPSTPSEEKKVEIVLEGKQNPRAVANFIKLAKAKFYDGLSLGSMPGMQPGMQVLRGGDPVGDGSGGPGYEVKIEQNGLQNPSSAVGSLPTSPYELTVGGSQFYIALTDLPQFNHRLYPFGWVKNGLDALRALKTDGTIKNVEISEYAGDEECPLIAKAPPRTPSKWSLPTPAEVAKVQQQGRYLATITMMNGKQVQIVLEGKSMPNTVANFVKLAQAKFYDNLIIHRVDPGDLVQGGDPNGNGSGDPGYALKFEKSNLLHKAGALSMARAQDIDSAGCQFFITMRDIPGYDGNYAAFGWVKSGLDVIKDMKKGDKMMSVTVTPYDGKEDCPMVAQGQTPSVAPAIQVPPAPPVAPPAPAAPSAQK